MLFCEPAVFGTSYPVSWSPPVDKVRGVELHAQINALQSQLIIDGIVVAGVGTGIAGGAKAQVLNALGTGKINHRELERMLPPM